LNRAVLPSETAALMSSSDSDRKSAAFVGLAARGATATDRRPEVAGARRGAGRVAGRRAACIVGVERGCVWGGAGRGTPKLKE
jgi:hypothetical protein